MFINYNRHFCSLFFNDDKICKTHKNYSIKNNLYKSIYKPNLLDYGYILQNEPDMPDDNLKIIIISIALGLFIFLKNRK
jgi:hypothetical protein